MTSILTVRIPPALLSKAEAKAARLGLDRAKYFRSLLEKDLAETDGEPTHKFASEDLVGYYTAPLPVRPATNARVREVMRQRQLARREKNR